MDVNAAKLNQLKHHLERLKIKLPTIHNKYLIRSIMQRLIDELLEAIENGKD